MFFEVNGLTSAGASRLNQEIRKQEAQGPSKGESIFAAQKPNPASTTSASNDTPPEAKKIANKRLANSGDYKKLVESIKDFLIQAGHNKEVLEEIYTEEGDFVLFEYLKEEIGKNNNSVYPKIMESVKKLLVKCGHDKDVLNDISADDNAMILTFLEEELTRPTEIKKTNFGQNQSSDKINKNLNNVYIQNEYSHLAGIGNSSTEQKATMINLSRRSAEQAKYFDAPGSLTMPTLNGNAVTGGAFGQYSSNNGVTTGEYVLGQFSTGNNSRMTFGGMHTKVHGENAAQLFNADVTEQMHAEILGKPVDIDVSASVSNFRNETSNVTNLKASVKTTTSLPG